MLDRSLASASGLTSHAAKARLAQYGPNEPAPTGHWTWMAELRSQLLSPLVLILLIAAATSGFLGQRADAIILVVMVVAGVGLNFIQSSRSQVAAKKLRDQVAVHASVLRDDHWTEIPRVEVVPGDLVSLSAGDLIPADGMVLEANHLYVHEAALTGESMPAEKSLGGKLFLGTSVVSGSAILSVERTGKHTEFGEIAARLAAHPPETAFERDLKHFSLFILRAVLFLVLLLTLASLQAHRDPMQSLLFAVALAVGLTPEFLPVIISVTLTSGAIKMSANGWSSNDSPPCRIWAPSTYCAATRPVR